MLSILSLQNFLLFEHIEIECSEQLNTLTGETGAGKSILIDAIELAFGAKASPDLILKGQSSACITLVFTLDKRAAQSTQTLMAENHIPFDGEVIIRREIPLTGRSRIRINDTLVSIPFLEKIKETLLVIQGQFDPSGLLSTAKHRQFLDKFGKSDTGNVQKAYQHWQETQNTLDAYLASKDQYEKESDLLRFYLEELDELAPLEDEWQQLALRLPFLKKAAATFEKMNHAYQLLHDDAMPTIDKTMRTLDSTLQDEQFEDIYTLLQSGREDLYAGIEMLREKAQELLLEMENVPELEDRAYSLRECARKHRIDGQDLVKFHHELREKVAALEESESSETELKAACEEAKRSYIHAAKTVKAQRETAAKALENLITKELQQLAMGKCVFEVCITCLEEKNWGQAGTENVSFQISTNPSKKTGPLSAIASGGELNRILLAMQVALAEELDYHTIIFDEIDSGISGKTAAILGKRLKKLADTIQILAITHAPQVAAAADTHFLIQKNAEHTRTTIQKLQPADRIENIARMISGTHITDDARNAAHQLLKESAETI